MPQLGFGLIHAELLDREICCSIRPLETEEFRAQRVLVLRLCCLDGAAHLVFVAVRLLPLVDFDQGMIFGSERLFLPYRGNPCLNGGLMGGLQIVELGMLTAYFNPPCFYMTSVRIAGYSA
jgi:hypothetical protein